MPQNTAGRVSQSRDLFRYVLERKLYTYRLRGRVYFVQQLDPSRTEHKKLRKGNVRFIDLNDFV